LEPKRQIVSLALADPSAAMKYRMRRHVPTIVGAGTPPTVPGPPV
jgi:hypothetical protein